ncbi:cell wall-associated NlpC family hydrolase [Prauserella shujinwangii]|uniref:Cell wall-associated NlpC family hydrolase n=1 Tax=Prauserella shujinwangii TaxID=1453103 RepID=A0A2T0LPI9_9PSEU|nr:NlpC/P60 family protein [Prauserella shujinwangii]PRX45114.1 cell wall-associated NlpC family hydrolase [Prauserella shujinwangii]
MPHGPGLSAGLRSAAAAGALALVALLGAGGTAVAVPPPPPNPSDSELAQSRRAANARASEVGQLANRLARAESRLAELRDEVALKMEEANKALVDLRAAQDAARTAEREAVAARAQADAAAAAIERKRAALDRFVAGSYQQGSTIGSVGAYLGSDSPRDLLARAQLLDAVSGSQLDALASMRQARVEKANKDAAARKALELAEQRREEAEDAKAAADAAQAAAIQARRAQAARADQLEAEKNSVERQLYAAQSRVDGLEDQRQRYQEWLAQKRREEAAQAQQAASSSAGSSAPSGGPAPAGPSSASVESVIARAMSQLGVTYAWGGGNASGPTRGIRDGGVADSYGDYNKIGFDCSGLMIYAFAGVKSLPHYSGYQYYEGRHVPLSQARRGDMLFWGPGRIHHVALYLGNGQMIEAPYSGGRVRIAPVRYDGIMPYATRLIG